MIDLTIVLWCPSFLSFQHWDPSLGSPYDGAGLDQWARSRNKWSLLMEVQNGKHGNSRLALQES